MGDADERSEEAEEAVEEEEGPTRNFDLEGNTGFFTPTRRLQNDVSLPPDMIIDF